MLLSEKDVRRFWSKVDRKGDRECWPWKAKAALDSGYGLMNIWVEPGKRRNVVASRISCFLAHGSPPHASAKSLHSCDNPTCCNPSHLRWGTQLDNVADAKERKRHVNPPRMHSNPEWNAKRLAAMPKGEALHNQSLTEAQAREVMRLHMDHRNVSQISEATGIKKHAIADICRGRSWRHLEGIPSLDELKTGGVRRGFNQFS